MIGTPAHSLPSNHSRRDRLENDRRNDVDIEQAPKSNRLHYAHFELDTTQPFVNHVNRSAQPIHSFELPHTPKKQKSATSSTFYAANQIATNRAGELTTLMLNKLYDRAKNQPRPHWHNLPMEVKTTIFSYLDFVQKELVREVCKEWRQVYQDRSLWTCFDVQSAFEQREFPLSRFLQILRTIGHHVRTLNLRGFLSLDPASLLFVATQCPNITTLHMGPIFDGVWEPFFWAFLQQMSNLRNLSLRGVSVLCNDDLMGLKHFSHLLHSLDLSGCYKLTSSAIVEALGLDQQMALHTLLLAGISMAEYDLEKIAKNCRFLAHLDLRGEPNLIEQTTIGLAPISPPMFGSLTHQAHAFFPLKTINLSNTMITDSCIVPLTCFSATLRKVFLSSCPHITSAGILELARECNLLTHIDLEDVSCVSDEVLSCLAQATPKLMHLCLAGCELVSDQGVCRTLEACRDLQVLELDSCWQITDRTIHVLLEKNRPSKIHKRKPQATTASHDWAHAWKLRKLDLTDCINITSTALQSLVKARSPTLDVVCPLISRDFEIASAAAQMRGIHPLVQTNGALADSSSSGNLSGTTSLPSLTDMHASQSASTSFFRLRSRMSLSSFCALM